MRLAVLTTLVTLTMGAHALAQQQVTPPARSLDSSDVRWARVNAIPLPSVDAPYADTAFAFLRPLVGSARVLEVGEYVHGGHEPLAFRNEVIRYSVTHLGFTAVALESGFTESDVVDRFIQGESGNIDSVVRTGFTWQFETLPENRDLVEWLRAHNAHATRKVHFYGIDVTGGNDTGVMPGASGAVLAALDYLASVAPALGAPRRARLLPLMDRFKPARYPEYSATERDRLKASLDSLYQILLIDSTRFERASARAAYARGLRNAWMAIQLNEMMAPDTTARDSIGYDGLFRVMSTHRDSMMAENTQWVLQQEGHGGRLIVFAHDGHVMNVRVTRDSTATKLLGYYLRPRFGSNLVILASTAGTIIGGTGNAGGWIGGTEEARADPTSFPAVLAAVGLPTFVLEGRTADRMSDVAAALAKPWLFFAGERDRPAVVPRQAFDAVVYFDRVTPSKVQQ